MLLSSLLEEVARDCRRKERRTRRRRKWAFVLLAITFSKLNASPEMI
jgi:hypothetical protein